MRAFFIKFSVIAFSLLIGGKALPTQAAAAELKGTFNGAKLYTYQTNCAETIGSKSGQPILEPTQGFIVPDGATYADTMYIYYRGTNNPSPQELCTNSGSQNELCAQTSAIAKKGVKIVTLLAIEDRGQGGSEAKDQNLTTKERKCYLTEAQEKVKSVLSLSTNPGYILVGHSLGSNTILSFLQQNPLGKAPNRTVILDGCFNDRCKKISNLANSGPVSIYSTNYDGNLEEAKAAKADSSDKVSLWELADYKSFSQHKTIPGLCFANDVIGGNCKGKATPGLSDDNSAPRIGRQCVHDYTDDDCETDDGNATNEFDCEASLGYKPENPKFCVCDIPAQCKEKYGDEDPGATWECKDGIGASFDLDFCQSSNGKVFYPLTTEKPAPTSDISHGFSNAPLSESELQALLQEPVPKITIPGLSFTDISVLGSLSPDETGDTYLEVPYLGEYLAALYRYLVIIAGIICVARIIIGGFVYSLPDSSGNSKSAAKTMISQALVGLVITVTSYVILYSINPELVQFKNLRVLYIHGKPLADYEELPEITGYGFVQGGSAVSADSAKNIGGLLGGPNTLGACTIEAAQAAAQKLNDAKVCVGPCHCAWTATRFSSYIGCGNKTLTGDANSMVSHLEREGWISHEIGSDFASIPVGMLWFPGHAGFSIAGGKVFESTIGGGLTHAAEGGNCPGLYTQMTDPNQCNYCAKIAAEGPATGKYWRKSGKGCQDNQGWFISGSKRVKEFRLVISPPKSGQTAPPLGCCTATVKKTRLLVTSKLACEHFNIESVKRDKSGNVTNPPPDLTGKWNPNITDPEVCNPPKKKK